MNKNKNQDTEELQNNLYGYIEAYKNKDIDTLQNFWSEDASYFNPQTGKRIHGRSEIMDKFSSMFKKYPEAELIVSQENLEILDDSHALEKGTSRVYLSNNENPIDSKYTIQYIKENNHWLIQNVAENDISFATKIPQELQELDWLIGKWVDETPNIKIETNSRWILNNHYIQSNFILFYKDKSELSGKQFIGWDPHEKKVKSWIFDSDGGFGEGIWSKSGPQWTVFVKSILPNGHKASSKHTYSLIDNNSYKFSITDREINGETLPNLEEISVIRKKST